MKKYDLHIHSHYSPCSIISPKMILKRAKKAGLNGIAITDHHTLKAYSILKRLNKDKNFEIIAGEEITTQYGDVLALYLKKEIKTRDFFELIKEVKRQNGIIIIPHPITISKKYSFRYPLKDLKKIFKGIDFGFEIHNSRNFIVLNNKSKILAKKHNFAQTGSSDAHLPIDIGNGYVLFNETKDDLRSALKYARTIAGGTTKYNVLSCGISIISTHFFYYIRKIWLK
jgi:hypothetical protein